MIPYGLLFRVGGVLALAIAAAWAWHRITEGYRDEGRAEVRAEWERDRAQRIAVTERIAGAWEAEKRRAEVATNERDKARSERFKPVSEGVRSLPAEVAGIRIPADAVGVFNAAIVAGNASPTGTAAEPATPAAALAAGSNAGGATTGASSVGLLVGWVADAAAVYAECRDRVSSWEQWYAGLRAGQTKESL